MARILKFVHSETGGVTRFDRESLEEFPEEPVAPAGGDAEGGGAVDETPLDPDAIREEILAAARVDAAQKVQEAYREGLEQGAQKGREQFEASLAQCTEALESASEAIQAAHERFVDSLEPQVVALVKSLVTRVIDTERRTNPEVLQQTVRRALEKLAGQYAVTLHLHPDDLAAIQAHEVALLDGVPGVESLQLVPSDGVQPGGCIARSESMEVDARLETLLGQVLDALTE